MGRWRLLISANAYSLKAQVEKHLHISLDKTAQQSDWSLRPLPPKQLDYAARDAVATLLLYEHQRGRSLNVEYRLRPETSDEQADLPLSNSLPQTRQVAQSTPAVQPLPASADLSDVALALLGIITELPSSYSPERLAVCVGDDRVGLAGWIIDRILGEETEIDESSAKLEIAALCQRGLVSISPTRRLEANAAGRSIWRERKPA